MLHDRKRQMSVDIEHLSRECLKEATGSAIAVRSIECAQQAWNTTSALHCSESLQPPAGQTSTFEGLFLRPEYRGRFK